MHKLLLPSCLTVILPFDDLLYSLPRKSRSFNGVALVWGLHMHIDGASGDQLTIFFHFVGCCFFYLLLHHDSAAAPCTIL